eukprot:gene949-1201_t
MTHLQEFLRFRILYDNSEEEDEEEEIEEEEEYQEEEEEEEDDNDEYESDEESISYSSSASEMDDGKIYDFDEYTVERKLFHKEKIGTADEDDQEIEEYDLEIEIDEEGNYLSGYQSCIKRIERVLDPENIDTDNEEKVKQFEPYFYRHVKKLTQESTKKKLSFRSNKINLEKYYQLKNEGENLNDQDGDGFPLVTRYVDVSLSTVKRTIGRYEERGDFNDREKIGRKKVFSDRVRRTIKRSVIEGDIISERNGILFLKERYDITMSKTTLGRILKEEGFNYQRLSKKQKLTAKHAKQRLDYALAHRDWTVEQWKSCIFADESTFQTLPKNIIYQEFVFLGSFGYSFNDFSSFNSFLFSGCSYNEDEDKYQYQKRRVKRIFYDHHHVIKVGQSDSIFNLMYDPNHTLVESLLPIKFTMKKLLPLHSQVSQLRLSLPVISKSMITVIQSEFHNLNQLFLSNIICKRSMKSFLNFIYENSTIEDLTFKSSNPNCIDLDQLESTFSHNQTIKSLSVYIEVNYLESLFKGLILSDSITSLFISQFEPLLKINVYKKGITGF